MTRSQRRELFKGLAFISPWIIGFLALMLYPVGASLYYSFCDFDVLSGATWIGAQNYRDMAGDDLYWKALYNTLFYAGLSLPMGLVTALLVAVMLNRPIPARSVFRTIYFLPSMVPVVGAAMIWMWVFNGEYSLLNYALGKIGINGPQWLQDPAWTKPSLVLMSIWGIGNQIVIYLAALQDVPRHLYESADIDGANAAHKLWHVTIPMISPVIYFNLIMGIIGSLQVFVQPYIMMPEGGPDRSGYLYTWYLYDTAFTYLNMGYACAMAWVLFVIIMVLTWLATTATRRHIYYGGA